jgi:circadian clock protein KaiB
VPGSPAPPPPIDSHRLRLYVAGAAPASTRAVEVLRSVLDRGVPGPYELEIVDVYQQPLLALEANIMTVPTLVRLSPGPMRRIVGLLSDAAHVLHGLDLHDKPAQEKRPTRKKH